MKRIHRKIIVVVAFATVVAIVVIASIFIPPLALLGLGLGYAVGVTFAKDISAWVFNKKREESDDDIESAKSSDFPEFFYSENDIPEQKIKSHKSVSEFVRYQIKRAKKRKPRPS